MDVRHVLPRREMDLQRANQVGWRRLGMKKAEGEVRGWGRGICPASVVIQKLRPAICGATIEKLIVQ